jgi:hypothetical protein
MLWQTRDGRVIDVKDMSDTHLQNSIAYMERRVTAMQRNENSMWGAYTMLQGEQAQYAAEAGLGHAAEAIIDAQHSLRGLQAEKKRREQKLS